MPFFRGRHIMKHEQENSLITLLKILRREKIWGRGGKKETNKKKMNQICEDKSKYTRNWNVSGEKSDEPKTDN